MPRTLLTLCTAITLALAVAGCPAECEEDDHVCEGADEIRTCVDGQWSEPEACPAGEECMTMENGVTHCMAMM